MISFPSGFANHLFPFFAGEDFWVLFFFGYVVYCAHALFQFFKT